MEKVGSIEVAGLRQRSLLIATIWFRSAKPGGSSRRDVPSKRRFIVTGRAPSHARPIEDIQPQTTSKGLLDSTR